MARSARALWILAVVSGSYGLVVRRTTRRAAPSVAMSLWAQDVMKEERQAILYSMRTTGGTGYGAATLTPAMQESPTFWDRTPARNPTVARSLAQCDLDSPAEFEERLARLRTDELGGFPGLGNMWLNGLRQPARAEARARAGHAAVAAPVTLELPEPVRILRSRLADLVRYLKPEDGERVLQTFTVAAAAMQAHCGGFDEVALRVLEEGVALCDVLATVGIGRDPLVAAVLHPAVEIGAVTAAELESAFGPSLSALVLNSVDLARIESVTSLLSAGDDAGKVFHEAWRRKGQSAGTGAPAGPSVGQGGFAARIESLLVDARASGQAENLQNLMLALADDWVALLLVVARNLVHLRAALANPACVVPEDLKYAPAARVTLGREVAPVFRCDPHNVAQLSMHVYAPLARLMGILPLQAELENSAFAILDPATYREISAALAEQEMEVNAVLAEAKRMLKEAIIEDSMAMNYVDRIYIRGRVKKPYSIHKKMRRKGLRRISELGDLVALRVVLSCSDETVRDTIASVDPDEGVTSESRAEVEEALCYYTLDQVHRLWPHDPERRRDYIQRPKGNGYQSLHTTCALRNEGENWPLEVQVRTMAMHDAAEYGMCAHWWYKERNDMASAPPLPAPHHFSDREELLGWLKDVHRRNVYVITQAVSGPGRVTGLTRGSTVRDLRRAVRLLGEDVQVLVNGAPEALDYELKDGDLVQLS